MEGATHGDGKGAHLRCRRFSGVQLEGIHAALPSGHLNEELQRENKAPVYYWLPNKVRLALKDGDEGDYVFSFIHFEGLSEEANINVAGGGTK